MTNKQIFLLASVSVLSISLNAKALTMNEILQVMTAGNHILKNHDENNSEVSISVFETGFGFSYGTRKEDKVDSSNNNSDGWPRINATVNGQPVPGKTPQVYHSTYDFDENGKLQAVYNCNYPGWGCNGELLETYKYADNGQMLVYNPQGQLIGAYNNWSEKMMSKEGYYDRPQELNHIDTDGNYTSKDGNNNITGVYHQDGKVEKYKYNSAGNVISSETYDKNGNQTGSYTYDAGGNLVSAYQNGKAVYLRKRYTIPEADAATQGKGPFRLDITW